MPYAAISYRVKPGHEDEIAEIFSGFQRVQSPDLTDAQGALVGRLLGTSVFVKDDVLVRVIHYEGDFAAIGRHLAGEPGVHILEEQLAPFLAVPRDTTTPQGFQAYFRDATMRKIAELSVHTHPTQT